MKKKKLYAFDWVGGGWNQVYAHSKVEALKEIKKEFPESAPRATNLRVEKDHDAYYRSHRWD